MDYRTSVLDNFKIDEFVFCSNFDSGNLGKVELVPRCAENSTDLIVKEFNVWTTPDCFGTPRQSPNRTWFFFSIRGGRTGQTVRINVKNLNRQSKLFSQGMQPVMRVGHSGKWERIKDRPTFQNEESNFAISFLHRVLDSPDTDYFYAFTFPFTYTECQTMLEKFDYKFLKTAEDFNVIINRLSTLESTEKDELPTVVKSKKKIATNYPKQKSMSPPDPAPVESLDCNSNGDLQIFRYSQATKKELENEIYYYRENLINSLEGRRVDLLTITSFHGIENKREEKLPNLFPDSQIERCHCFPNKKVIFLSSRVHPGETPASFVLNGFLNLLLDRKNPTAISLRKTYVFKIVPILNPDGVYRGFYRTDTLGQNLNRWYTNPQLDMHPTIYGVKKIIRFYRFGYDVEDDGAMDISTPPESSVESVSVASLTSDDEKLPSEKSVFSQEDGATSPNEKAVFSQEDGTTSPNESNSNESDSNEISNKSMKMACSEETSDESSVKSLPTPRLLALPDDLQMKRDASSASSSKASHIPVRRIEPILKKSATVPIKIPITFAPPPPLKKRINVTETGNINISTDFLDKNGETTGGRANNMFLYIDFHGHAAKKGVFMYGNHFSNIAEAVECKLLPKLMSINSQHFHYDACNFSEKNMYRREKRDGLSKEGSGRVAVYKMTGLIKSYTLEGNYNTGRYVNLLPNCSNSVSTKKALTPPSAIPPKYTPAVFEEVGRALGSSILDLTNSNSNTRLQHSEYRTLQGVRSTLRHDIERNIANHRLGKSLTPTYPTNVKRTKRSPPSSAETLSPTCNEQAKENKAQKAKLADLLASVPSTSSSTVILQHPSSQTSKLFRPSKKATLKARPAAAASCFSKKDTSAFAKKKQKILGESSNSGTLQLKKIKTCNIEKTSSASELLSSASTSGISKKSLLSFRSSATSAMNFEKHKPGTSRDRFPPLQIPNYKSSMQKMKFEGTSSTSESSRLDDPTITPSTSSAHDPGSFLRMQSVANPTESVQCPNTAEASCSSSSRPGVFVSPLLKPKVRSAFIGADKTKLIKKKRAIRHDSITVKRKTKIKTCRQH